MTMKEEEKRILVVTAQEGRQSIEPSFTTMMLSRIRPVCSQKHAMDNIFTVTYKATEQTPVQPLLTGFSG